MRSSSERAAASAPARFAEPRIVFVAVALALTAFGLLMIFSSSSVTALTSEGNDYNPAYYLQRQLIFAALGVVLAIVVASQDYHRWSRTLLYPLWGGTVLLLLAILTPIAGQGAYGATRWIAIGPFTLQPSEFAKATIILTAATLAEDRFQEGTLVGGAFMGRVAVLLGVPLVLVLLQPDKGTVIICGATLVVMLLLAGEPIRHILGIVALGAVGILFLSLKDDYSRARILTMLDPWRDPYNEGYQLIQGFYAFGSGGLFGVGLGMSRQKYSYLPMAYNDFIFAVVGEELGLVGTLLVLAAFLVLLWMGFRIARLAPDLSGRLIAAGSSTLLVVQLLVNVCGVLGLMPLSGKPVPFISYGGSSIMGSLILVGLVVSVSRSSGLPHTVYDERRASLTLYDGTDRGRGLRVYTGGRQQTPESLRSSRDFLSEHEGSRITTNANGSRRIELGPSARDRLRGRDGGRGTRR